MASCILDRRSLLAAMLIGTRLASIDQAWAEVAPALRVVLGFGRSSFAARGFSLFEGGLARELRGPVEQIYMVGDRARGAAATVAAAGPDEPVVLVANDFEAAVIPIVYADVAERPDSAADRQALARDLACPRRAIRIRVAELVGVNRR